MLTIQQLNKTYASGVHALNNIDLSISRGMFGLLGPNGAGKTTLMKILATLLDPDSGTAEFDDVDLINRRDKADPWLSATGVWSLSDAHGRTDA